MFSQPSVYSQDGKIPLEKFVEILEQDQVWKDSVPQTLKDKIIREVRDERLMWYSLS